MTPRYPASHAQIRREVEALPAAWREAYEERAAIREHMGDMDRLAAEKAALLDVRREMERR